MNKVAFISQNGLKLTGIWHLPSNPTTKAVVLAHGITVDKDESGIFVELAEKLAEDGYGVFRFDFRGHGESEGKPEDMTLSGEINDLTSAVEHVKQKGFKDVGLVGASFGGGIAALYASKNQDKLKALCLWNPCLDYDHCFLNPTLPWLVERKGHMRKEIESRGWTTVGSRKYKIGKNLWEEMGRYTPFEGIRQIRIPLAVLHAKNDSYVPYEDSKNYVQGVGELITISGGGHGFHDKPFDKEAIGVTRSFFKAKL